MILIPQRFLGKMCFIIWHRAGKKQQAASVNRILVGFVVKNSGEMPQGWTSDISKGVMANIIYLNDYNLTRMTIMTIVVIRK